MKTPKSSGSATKPSVRGKSPAAVSRQRRAASTPPPPTPAPTPAPARMLIEIDPTITGGFIADRYDLQLRGRVVSTVPIEAVALLTGDTMVGRARYGRPDPTTSITLPDGSIVTQQAFGFTIPRPRDAASAPCKIAIAAQTTDGQAFQQDFELQIDPRRAIAVEVIAGPTRPLGGIGAPPVPLVVYVERAALDDLGYLLLQGWAVALSGVVTIQLFLDDERIAEPTLGGRRDDVGAILHAYPNAPTCGFKLLERIGPRAGSGAIRVRAMSLDGFSSETVLPLERTTKLGVLPPPERATATSSQRPESGGQPQPGGQPSPDASAPAVDAALAELAQPGASAGVRRNIRLRSDSAELTADGVLAVGGWVVCGVGITGVSVQLDGEFVGDAEIGLPRRDIVGHYPDIEMAAFSGFRLTVAVPPPRPGTHLVRVIARNKLDDTADHERRVVVTEGSRSLAPAPALAVEPAEFRLEIDNPSINNGLVVEPITGRLTIEGWVLARPPVRDIEVLLDDQRLGDAHFGLARQDVAVAFPDWDGALRSGFAFHCPPRSLHNGTHMVQLQVRAQNGDVLVRSFRIDVRKTEDGDDFATVRRRIPRVEADHYITSLTKLNAMARFQLVLRQPPEIEPAHLALTLASLRDQIHHDWRLLVLVENAVTGAAVREIVIADATPPDPRIVVADLSDDAVALAALAGDAAAGDIGFVGLLSPGDQLGCEALAEIALAGAQSPAADLIYADEARISPASHEREPFFKPDYSPDLLLSTNYIGRPWFVRAALLNKIGATPRTLAQYGEYDLLLRCAEAAAAIQHVPRLLCVRGPVALDPAELERQALERSALRRGEAADVLDGCVSGSYRLRRKTQVSGLVSIIIPTCAAHGYIETCIKTLRANTAYRNIEIVCVDNIPQSQPTWKVWLRDNADMTVEVLEPFNWSHFNNVGAAASHGEYLLFLNDDIEILQPDWLDALLEHAARPEVGVVGPQLLYPGGKVQHAGLFLSSLGLGRHAFRFADGNEPGYFGLARTQRNVIAVTGACMMMRREHFDALGGFEEAHEIINNDLDFCLRGHQAGKLTVFTPYATLTHHELASRGGLQDVFDLTHFTGRWRTRFAAGDPFHNVNLSTYHDDYRPNEEPAKVIYAGHPLFGQADIKRILVVKVDHIGDFITALPAIRRLKAHFPAASIRVLAAPAARAFARLEHCIDEIIPFEFFHARSALGRKTLGTGELQALREQLEPYRFDLAVDLRKHLDTRELLRYSSARYLAGFDYAGQYPWLDVALEWEGDRGLQPKRYHISDALLHLIDAIATSCDSDRDGIGPEGLADLAVSAPLPQSVRHLFTRRVVCVHAGAGNDMKQWPPEYFVGVIDLLISQHAVNVVLIGGPDDLPITAEILAAVAEPQAVGSIAGELPLADLPAFMARCSLYLGNDSGPKHIAAAIGVPTVGVHSGTVDPREWAPMGPNAVAVAREMACAPCYLSKLADCVRDLACLRQLEPGLVYRVCARMLGPDPAVTGVAVAGVVVADPSDAPPSQAARPPRKGSRRRTEAARS